jgi:hypothetical protein
VPEAKQKNDDIVVFITHRDGQCAECGEAFSSGNWIRLEKERPLCMRCADLAHLEYLPPGNATLTRRAGKYSPLRAVLLQWARARKRYERQGILVTAEAIQRAEEECLADAELRARRRERASVQREAREPAYVNAATEVIRQNFPACPPDEVRRIAEWTCEKHSGRVGRSAAAKDLNIAALRLAVVAHIRHEHTDYDRILMRTNDRVYARAEVADKINDVLTRWETGTAEV